MAFKGIRRSIGDLIGDAVARPEPDWHALYGDVGLRNTAADAAHHCAQLISEGASPDECWRFGILQTLDYYDSAVRRGGISLGKQVFSEEPERTGDQSIDAAFAALADHVATRDGWESPAWAKDESRHTSQPWYAMSPASQRNEAQKESPRSFRDRGIFITPYALARA